MTPRWSAFLLPLFLAGTLAAAPVSIKRIDGTTIPVQEVEAAVSRLMAAAHVTGLQVAILNDNRPVYVHSFGLRDVAKHEPLTPDTVMYGASFTKAAFAVLVMQLADQRLIDLDVPVYRYLEKPLPQYEKYTDLATDDRWKLITARMLLSHTTGFPNFRWINDDQKLDIKFAPGSRYSYSGEGINLLGFVIESITKRPLDELMQERVFGPLGMTRTSMKWEPRFEENYALGYDEKGAVLGHSKRSNARAAGSMDTTISDYARFLSAVMAGRALAPRAQREMLKPQIGIYSVTQFPTPRKETTGENRGIQLSYGLGWGLFVTPYGKAFFKEGHDDGWENHAVAFPDRKIAVILMSNSSNGDSIYRELLATLIGDTFTPWKWEGYVPYDEKPHY